MAQVPHADEGLICPLHKEDMSKVCHKCPLWYHIRGTDANTGQEVDRWDCALAWLPMLLVENSLMQRQTGAAVESFRNVVAETAEAREALMGQTAKGIVDAH